MATMETHVPAEPSAHLDTFARDHLPPRELWPVMDYGGLPELAYPPRLNCAVELLDRTAAAGHADRPAILWDGGRWPYRELAETSNRIAAVLRDDLGVIPGNRVLLRGPNSPMMAACWFGVLKAGGIVVATMPPWPKRRRCTSRSRTRASPRTWRRPAAWRPSSSASWPGDRTMRDRWIG
jgi:2-aminobenzoate-CoA ligase